MKIAMGEKVLCPIELLYVLITNNKVDFNHLRLSFTEQHSLLQYI
jgi:hypothetical protein